ncbi:MAG: hypothetical protein HQL53_07995 [Magnetococcales bacterium]|nr:hypothetical protein [Magnetococcales bacterium]
MYYAIICKDAPNSLALRLASRLEHRERLRILEQQDRLLIAGPFPKGEKPEDGFSGSLIVAEFDSQESATFWAETDPYMLNGTYQSVEVLPFKHIY